MKHTKSCPDCKHCKMTLAATQAQLVCRAHPPAAAAIPVPTHAGINVQVITIWPPVTASDYCGEFAAEVLQ